MLLLVQLKFQRLWYTTHCFLRRGAVAKCLCMDSLRPCTLLVVCEPIIMEGGGADEGWGSTGGGTPCRNRTSCTQCAGSNPAPCPCITPSSSPQSVVPVTADTLNKWSGRHTSCKCAASVYSGFPKWLFLTLPPDAQCTSPQTEYNNNTIKSGVDKMSLLSSRKLGHLQYNDCKARIWYCRWVQELVFKGLLDKEPILYFEEVWLHYVQVTTINSSLLKTLMVFTMWHYMTWSSEYGSQLVLREL